VRLNDSFDMYILNKHYRDIRFSMDMISINIPIDKAILKTALDQAKCKKNIFVDINRE